MQKRDIMKQTLTISLIFFAFTVFSQGSGYALNFDGTSDYIRIDEDPTLDITADITISVWIKTNNITTNSYQRIIDKWEIFSGDNKRAYVIFQKANSGIISFHVSPNGTGASEVFLDATNPIKANEWTHIACVKSGTNAYFYINGVLSNSNNSFPVNIFDSPSDLLIGKFNPNTAQMWNGQMDEVRIWNIALTETQIRENMCKKLVGNETGLVAYYRMDEGANNTCTGGEDVCDETGNGNNGTKY